MTNNADVKMYGRAEYLEIEKPDRIVYTQQFCDEHENISRHPRCPTWPETMLTTVKLTEEGPDRTRVTVTWEPHGTDDARRARDVHQSARRHDARLDRLVRQAGHPFIQRLKRYTVDVESLIVQAVKACFSAACGLAPVEKEPRT